MTLVKTIKSLCTPAYIYLVISVVSIILLLIQNHGNKHRYCVGNLECDVASIPLMFAAKIVYTVFWVFVLNAICKTGYTNISWLLVLLPFILYFIALGILIILQNTNIEGLVGKKSCDKDDPDCGCN